MRKTLNDNPVVAVGVVGLLGMVVAFMLLHSISSRSSGGTSTSTTATAATTATTPGAVASTTATTATTSTSATPATVTPATPAAPVATVGEFKAGPGLPKPVVDAYDSNKVVVIVVLKQNGIEDQDVARATATLRGASNVAFFPTLASNVARFSRVTEGVDLNRVPAIIVIRSKKTTSGSTPQASVSYGFKSLEGLAQDVRDATYKGRENLPAYPR